MPLTPAAPAALRCAVLWCRKIGLQRSAVTRPVYMVSDAQQVLAECFLSTLQVRPLPLAVWCYNPGAKEADTSALTHLSTLYQLVKPDPLTDFNCPQNYLKSLMADLKAYTITDVTADNDRVRCVWWHSLACVVIVSWWLQFSVRHSVVRKLPAC